MAQSMAPSMVRWYGIPAELRLMILEALVDLAEEGRFKIGRFACVSRSWRDFIEKRTFKELALEREHLPYFKGLMESTHGYYFKYIRRIKLCIKLDKYNCEQCAEPESRDQIRK